LREGARLSHGVHTACFPHCILALFARIVFSSDPIFPHGFVQIQLQFQPQGMNFINKHSGNTSMPMLRWIHGYQVYPFPLL
jgi:hypothetical protein